MKAATEAMSSKEMGSYKAFRVLIICLPSSCSCFQNFMTLPEALANRRLSPISGHQSKMMVITLMHKSLLQSYCQSCKIKLKV
jgi:hypothetical protein